jgi:signal transduction histidine kinase
MEKEAYGPLKVSSEFELGRRSASGSIGQIVLLSVFVYATRFEHLSAWSIGPFAGMIFALNVLRFVLSQRQRSFYPKHRRLWNRLFTLSVLGSAIAWGTLFMTAIGKTGLSSYMTTISVLLGSGIAAAMTMSLSVRHKLARVVDAFLIGLPLIQLLLLMTRQSLSMAVVFVVYYYFLWSQLKIAHDIYWVGKASEAELEHLRMKSELTSKLSLLGEFTSSIAHEIRNPMTVISSAIQLIRKSVGKDECDAERIRRLADRGASTCARVDSIVNGLTRFARNTEGQPFLETKLINVIRDSVEMTRAHFLIHQVRLDLDRIDEEAIVYGRPVEISQVLINLLSNGLDAVKGLPTRWVRLRAEIQDDRVVITVSDSGPGIEPEIRERIFEPFFTTKPAGEGTGLGLSISRRIITRHGGQLEMDLSQPHTTFVVKLPVRFPQRRVG